MRRQVFGERHADSQTGAHVHHHRGRFEHFPLALQPHVDLCATRQGLKHVDITARAANVSGSRGKFHGAQQVRDFRNKYQRIARRYAAVRHRIRHSRNLLVR